MRLAWAVVLGVVAAAVVAWWLGPAETDPTPADGTLAPSSPDAGQAPALYRWRDDAGVVQITDAPPSGRPYETVDVGALERRNTFDPRTDAPATQ